MHDPTAARVLTLVSLLPLAIWIYLLVGRGSFWRVTKNLAPPGIALSTEKKVAVIIPARNEAHVIADTILSLRRQHWDQSLLRIVVVDDNSNDGTAEAARSAGGDITTVIEGKPLEPGWSGKLWALSQGIAKASATTPDFLLFTDADIRHDPTNLRTLVALAENEGYDLVSFMVKLSCSTFAERLLIPAFVFFFFQLYPPAWIRSRARRVAGAAGGCVLIRPQALTAIGGLASIRNEVIDDCALARAVKLSGGRVWLGLTPSTRSTRVYETFADVGSMISRTAFNQLRHSAVLLLGTVVGLLLTFVLPVVLIFSGSAVPASIGLTAYLLMTFAYLPIVRFYGLSPASSFTLPVAAIFYLGATINSAIRYWRGVGGNWKGRAQDVKLV